MDKLRQITADISVATADASRCSFRRDDTGESRSASRHSPRHNDSGESRSCGYDNVLSASTADTSNASTNTKMSVNSRFVSNTSVTLSPATLPPVVSTSPPGTRTAICDVRDSSNCYVSFSSSKNPPPATSVRQCPLSPAADVEKEWRQIVYAAETVVEGNSVDELSDTSFEHFLGPVESDHQRLVASAGGDPKSTGQPAVQPLLFANPLFLYKTSTRGSSGGSTSSLNSSVIQKSCSLTSVAESGDGDPASASPASGDCHRPPSVSESCSSQGYPVVTRRRVGSGAQGWKPSQSNECLTDGQWCSVL